MKKYSLVILLILGLYLSPSAHAEKTSVTIGGVQVDLDFTNPNGNNQWYLVNGTAKVVSTNQSCRIDGSLAYYGNYQPDRISVSCGDYIVRVDTIQQVVKNPVQGISFQLVTQVDYYGSKEFKVLGTKAIQLRFVEAQLIEAKVKSEKIDKY